jgi:hypothetical protein
MFEFDVRVLHRDEELARGHRSFIAVSPEELLLASEE